MLTFEEALEKLCVIPENLREKTDAGEHAEFTQPQVEFSPDIISQPQVKMLADMCVQTVIRLLVSAGHAPDLIPVGRECYLNGLILGVSIGVRMERNE